MLYETIKELCPSWEITNLWDFGLESADKVADFFNNGGLEIKYRGYNYAFQYAAIIGGKVEFGAWVWGEEEDFEDSTFEIYDEMDIPRKEREIIVNKIREIYDTPRN